MILDNADKNYQENVSVNSNEESELTQMISAAGIDVPSIKSVNVNENDTNDDVTGNESKDKSDVQEMNNFFAKRYAIYESVLAPELKENESLKREHKRSLMTNIFKLLKWQFIATYIFVMILIIFIGFSSGLKLENDVIVQVINFIEFYITSIVVELITILFFIVKDVFDKSIFDLFRNFDNPNKTKTKNKKGN